MTLQVGLLIVYYYTFNLNIYTYVTSNTNCRLCIVRDEFIRLFIEDIIHKSSLRKWVLLINIFRNDSSDLILYIHLNVVRRMPKNNEFGWPTDNVSSKCLAFSRISILFKLLCRKQVKNFRL